MDLLLDVHTNFRLISGGVPTRLVSHNTTTRSFTRVPQLQSGLNVSPAAPTSELGPSPSSPFLNHPSAKAHGVAVPNSLS